MTTPKEFRAEIDRLREALSKSAARVMELQAANKGLQDIANRLNEALVRAKRGAMEAEKAASEDVRSVAIESHWQAKQESTGDYGSY